MSVCTWPVDFSECGGSAGQSAFNSLSPEEQERVKQMAVDFLWNATNRVFGSCPVTVRPCAQSCFGNDKSTFWGNGPWAPGHYQSGGGWVPVLLGGLWYNLTCGCTSSCDCTLDGAKSLALPGPVLSILEVKIDGVVIDPANYRVTYGRYLTLIGDLRWPGCQDLNLPSTEEGTYEISYEKGLDVPAGGRIAAGYLANELAKALCGDNDCELPVRTTTVSRQGVTLGFMDMFEGLDDGKTGIWIIDAWITSVRPSRPIASVRSVDVKQPSAGSIPWPR